MLNLCAVEILTLPVDQCLSHPVAILAQGPFLSNNTLLSRVLRFWFCSFASCVSRTFMVRRGWQSMDVPSGWIQVLRGPRPKSVQWPLAKDRHQPGPQEGVSGRWRQPKSAKGAPPGGSRPRINPDVAREMAHTKVSRLERALEAMGDLQGRGSIKGRFGKGQGSVERAGEGISFSGGGSGASREIGGRAIQMPPDPRRAPGDTSDRAPANGEFVAVRARCTG